MAKTDQVTVAQDENEVIGTHDDLVKTLLEDKEVARGYLRENFLAGAVLALCAARERAGLSQATVAARMGTQQPSIARLERDLGGSLSLRRYVEYALAVDALPFDIVLGDFEKLRAYAIEHPGRELTQVAFSNRDHQVNENPMLLAARTDSYSSLQGSRRSPSPVPPAQNTAITSTSPATTPNTSSSSFQIWAA